MSKLTKTQCDGLRAVLNKYAWPGGYSVLAIMSDGDVLCPDCVRENLRIIAESTAGDFRDGWAFAAADVHWEGPSEFCAHCGKELPSEYGDPWVDEAEHEEIAA